MSASSKDKEVQMTDSFDGEAVFPTASQSDLNSLLQKAKEMVQQSETDKSELERTYKDQIQFLNNKALRLEMRLKEKDQAIDDMTHEIEQIKHKNTDNITQLQTLASQQNAQAQDEKQELQNEIDRMKDDLRANQILVDKLEVRLRNSDLKDAQIKNSEKQLESALNRIAELTNEKLKFNRHVDDLKDSIKSYREYTNSAKGRFRDFQAFVRKQQNEIKFSQQQKQTLNGRLIVNEKKHQELENKYRTAQDKIAELSRKVNNRAADKAALNQDQAKQLVEFKNANVRFKRAHEDLSRKFEERKKREKEIHIMMIEEREKRQELEKTLQYERTQLTEMAQQLQNEVEALRTIYPIQDLLTATESQILNLQKQFDQARPNSNEFRRLEKAISDLEKQRTQYSQMIAEADLRIDFQKERLALLKDIAQRKNIDFKSDLTKKR